MIKNVTLKDIAEQLEISANSVSRALRDCSDISEATKEKVKQTAEQMGYVPNSLASSLKKGETKLCVVVFDNLINPYFNIMAYYIEKELKKYGYDMLIYAADSVYLEYEGVQKIISKQGDAVITFLAPTVDSYQLVQQYGISLILLGRESKGLVVDTILTDDKKGGYLAAERLIKDGVETIIYPGCLPSIECSDRRYQGAQLCAQEHGVVCQRLDLDFGGEPGKMLQLDEMTGQKKTGIFAFNDQMAFAAIRHLKAQQIPVIGFDNLGREMEYPLELTTLAADKEALARLAVQALMKRKKENKGHVYKMLDVELIDGITA